jgi:hypothetical protein
MPDECHMVVARSTVRQGWMGKQGSALVVDKWEPFLENQYTVTNLMQEYRVPVLKNNEKLLFCT